jgi:hypothetical protein
MEKHLGERGGGLLATGMPLLHKLRALGTFAAMGHMLLGVHSQSSVTVKDCSEQWLKRLFNS